MTAPHRITSEKRLEDMTIRELVELSQDINPFVASRAARELVRRSEAQRHSPTWRRLVDGIGRASYRDNGRS
jgi:hypothetical protein